MANSQISHLIQEAQEKVAEQGLAASDRLLLLAAFGWLVTQLRPPSNGKRREVVVRIGLPVGAGMGIMGIVMAILQVVLAG